MICHRCWYEFELHHLLSIAEGDGLQSDLILGPQHALRFLSSRFDADGNAVDPSGATCKSVACPRCRLKLPRILTQCEPIFLSLLGAPGSGKSFFLASATWSLREQSNRLPFACIDPDPVANALLHEAEAMLFRPAGSTDLVSLKKTETSGSERYDETWFEGRQVSLPTPYVIALTEDAQKETTKDPVTVVLYDNAGEHHLPSDEKDSKQATGHLKCSASSIVLIDPIQHPGLRKTCSPHDPQVALAERNEAAPPRQELLITQAVASIRKMRNLRESDAIDQPLIIAVGKSDAWAPAHLGHITQDILIREDDAISRFDLEAIKTVSNDVRAHLEKHAPEITGTADALSSNVLYLPVSSTGGAPEAQSGSGNTLGFRAGSITPQWTMECLLLAIELANPGLLFSSNEDAVNT